MTTSPPDTIRILGIDPGSRATGVGIVDFCGDRVTHVTNAVIRTTEADFNKRLREIFMAAGELIAEYQPDELAIERVFVNRNADSALKLGSARAAVICGTFAADISVYEYAAREIKQALTGRGGAGKDQVQHMVRVLLGLSGEIAHDASDALAVAICHGHGRRSRTVLRAATA